MGLLETLKTFPGFTKIGHCLNCDWQRMAVKRSRANMARTAKRERLREFVTCNLV